MSFAQDFYNLVSMKIMHGLFKKEGYTNKALNF